MRSPIEALAGELGAFAAKTERSINQQLAAALMEMRAEMATIRQGWAETKLALAELEQTRAAETAARLATVKNGDPGKSVTIEDVAPMIQAEISRVVAALPPAEPGKDADPEVTRGMVAELVSEGFAALPAPKAGKDADPVDLDAVVAAVLARMPEPKPGKDADPEVVRQMVADAFAELPPAKDGADASIEDVRPIVAELVAESMATIPPAENGKDADPALVRELVTEAVTAAVAAIPPPAKGDPGPPGKIGTVKAWEDRVYYEGDIATHDGAMFQARCDTGRAPPHGDWDCIIPQAERGEPGRTFAIRGTWSEGEDYQSMDVVMLGGSSFVAKSDAPGACPGEGWQLLASAGKKGQVVNVKGDRGPPGPRIVSGDVDGEGVVTLRNADGSEVKIDLYPVLIKLRG